MYLFINILDFLETIKHEIIVVGTAMLPVVELKGAIPTGLALGLSQKQAFILAYVGSLLPVPILILFLKPIMTWLRKTKLLSWVADIIEKRTAKKGTKVRKYSLLGLFLFVAIPLPTTGVWTGSMIASFLDLRLKHAFPVIAIGNLIAGLIVTTISSPLF